MADKIDDGEPAFPNAVPLDFQCAAPETKRQRDELLEALREISKVGKMTSRVGINLNYCGLIADRAIASAEKGRADG